LGGVIKAGVARGALTPATRVSCISVTVDGWKVLAVDPIEASTESDTDLPRSLKAKEADKSNEGRLVVIGEVEMTKGGEPTQYSDKTSKDLIGLSKYFCRR